MPRIAFQFRSKSCAVRDSSLTQPPPLYLGAKLQNRSEAARSRPDHSSLPEIIASAVPLRYKLHNRVVGWLGLQPGPENFPLAPETVLMMRTNETYHWGSWVHTVGCYSS